MSERPYAVHVVVDPHFGERLRMIPGSEPIWIVDSPTNRHAFESVWKDHSNNDRDGGVTSFKVDPQRSPEDWLLSELETIDLHHGELSQCPPWSAIHVVGTKWTERIQTELAGFGFESHRDTADGFVAWRGAVQESITPIEQP